MRSKRFVGVSLLKGIFSSLLVVAISAAGCAETARGGEIRTLDRPVMRALVDAHDAARRAVAPAGESALTPLAWSDPLAHSAREWAAGCRFEHDPNRGATGENLFATTVQEARAAGEAAVASWVGEGSDFDAASKRCKDGKVCGHYTQVVWRATRRVGCAIAACNGGPQFKDRDWSFVVCRYEPVGNVVGEKPF